MTEGSLNLLLAGGGTGGHVIPALAVAHAVVDRGGQARFVGTKGRIEERLVPEAGFGIDFISVKPLAGRGFTGRLLGLGSVIPAVARSVSLLMRQRPDAVLGVGGYVAGPVVLAARLLGIKTALLEQNATVGMTNRLLSRVVNRAFVSYERTLSDFPKNVAEITGNPVPERLSSLFELPEDEQPGEKVSVLVMGGSQGARGVDTVVPAAFVAAGLTGDIRVLHQAGRDRCDEVDAYYQEHGIEGRVVPYIDDTAHAYRQADFVICRSGATTVAELTVAGVPAIFLPYPHHADNQQALNAQPMVEAGAAEIFDERALDEAGFAAAIKKMVTDGGYRRLASEAAKGLGKPDAATRIVDLLCELTQKR